ncbi:Nuclear RNA polymerase C2, putative [Theobroma cacao]|uniref:DNA-directed RNA polymerase n=1 Tax=Theobroma cacao TaxID=3641 RepID=A0A061E4G8_THECC|nr:Nuclear RNA polymerase C2, putative [Theobroma cacao]
MGNFIFIFEVKKTLYFSPSVKEVRALAILRDVFLANVPVHSNNFRPKCLYVAVMLRRMMEALVNKDAMDDKDYLGNKRFELSGQLISLLFEDLFKTMIGEVKKRIDIILSKPARSSSLDPSLVVLCLIFIVYAILLIKFLTIPCYCFDPLPKEPAPSIRE